jgi:hypothetical protein
MAEPVLICAAALVTYLGLALLAACQRPHWRLLSAGQAGERGQPGENAPPEARRRARWLASLALAIGLLTSLAGQGPAFGALLFTLLLGAASGAVTFTLTYRPRWLGPLQRALT